MPTYNYRCDLHGEFELHQKMVDHAVGTCPTCETECRQILLTPPTLDTEAMANMGMPGAFDKSGDRMTKRHLDAEQHYKHPGKVQQHR